MTSNLDVVGIIRKLHGQHWNMRAWASWNIQTSLNMYYMLKYPTYFVRFNAYAFNICDDQWFISKSDACGHEEALRSMPTAREIKA